MRTYHFDLPYTIGSFMLSMGWHQVHDDPMFAELPKALQHKILAAHEAGDELSLTRTDCDSIPDKTWAHVAAKLDLSYSGHQ